MRNDDERNDSKNSFKICKQNEKRKSDYFKGCNLNVKDLHTEGMIMKVVDERGRFIGKGYYGKQNKGYGWILTRTENESIDGAFFQQKNLKALGKRKALFENEDTTAFRVFNGEGDGIGGVTIDYFGWLLC